MTIYTKTIEAFVGTRLTPLATANTLAGATRYDSAQFTIKIPENISRTFRSVRLIATYRSEYAATNTVLGWRLGIKLGAALTSDLDRVGSGSNTASKNVYDVIDEDVTAYFNTNFGSGTSQTCVASLVVATTNVDAINSIVFKFEITYAADMAAQPRRTKTVRIPLQSSAFVLTTVMQEIGRDGTNPAPANQIPALDSWLPETNKIYNSIVLELSGNTNATGTFTSFVQLDGTAEVARAVIDGTLSTTLPHYDAYDITGLIDTSVAHSVSMRCSVTSHIDAAGGFVIVTYEYDASSPRLMCEAIIPLTNSSDDQNGNNGNFGFSAAVPADAMSLVAMLDVQEGNPTLVQSAAVLLINMNSAAVNPTVRAGGQAYRTYNVLSTSGDNPSIHRVDHGTNPWSLTRGINRLVLNHYTSLVSARGSLTGFAVINYTADNPGDPDIANHPVNYFGQTYAASVSQTIDTPTGTARIPVLGSPYKISGVLMDTYCRGINGNGQVFLAENAGEWDASGFISSDSIPSNAVFVYSMRTALGFTNSFNPSNLHKGKLDIEIDRRVVRYCFSGSLFFSYSWWITYHSIAFTVAGAITINGAPAPDGQSVEIVAKGANGAAEVVTTAVIAGGAGAYSAKVQDNTRQYRALYDDGVNRGSSAWGTPV